MVTGGLLDDDELLNLGSRRTQGTSSAASTSTPGVNKDLEAWMDAGTARPDKEAKGKDGQPGKDTCGMCGQRRPQYQCVQCKRPTCAADYWVMLALCRDCASEERVRRFRTGTGRAEGQNWLDGRNDS